MRWRGFWIRRPWQWCARRWIRRGGSGTSRQPGHTRSRVVRILAIESSCDETAAAVIEDETCVLSSVVASQFSVHGKYGGVVPELASREHLRAVVPVVREALERASVTWSGLNAVAATCGPGLAGS